MIDLFPVLVISVLILLNGLFVAAEFAIVATPRATIERLASQGHRLAYTVRQIVSEPRRQDQFIATAQLGITLTSLGLGMYGELVLADWIAQQLESLGASRWVAARQWQCTAVGILTYFWHRTREMVPKPPSCSAPSHRALQLL